MKFMDDTAVVELITHDSDTAYRDEVTILEWWNQNNHLSQRGLGDINGTVVETVGTFKYLDVNIHKDLTWVAQNTAAVRQAQQRL